MRLLWIYGCVLNVAADMATTTFLGRRSNSAIPRHLQSSAMDEKVFICEKADGSCWGWRGCGPEWTDTSNGRPRYWACAKGCPGGMFANKDCSCACQCGPGQHCLDVGTTSSPTPTPTSTPTTQISAEAVYAANVSSAEALKHESNAGSSSSEGLAIPISVTLGLLALSSCFACIAIRCIRTRCDAVFPSEVDTQRVHPEDFEIQHAEVSKDNLSHAHAETADEVSTQASSRMGTVMSHMSINSRSSSNSGGAMSKMNSNTSSASRQSVTSHTNSWQGRVMSHTPSDSSSGSVMSKTNSNTSSASRQSVISHTTSWRGGVVSHTSSDSSSGSAMSRVNSNSSGASSTNINSMPTPYKHGAQRSRNHSRGRSLRSDSKLQSVPPRAPQRAQSHSFRCPIQSWSDVALPSDAPSSNRNGESYRRSHKHSLRSHKSMPDLRSFSERSPADRQASKLSVQKDASLPVMRSSISKWNVLDRRTAKLSMQRHSSLPAPKSVNVQRSFSRRP